MNPLVSIIILNWNSRDLILNCLKSFAKVEYDNYEILVVDNGSTDDSIKTIRFEYPNVDIQHLEKNIGYAAGNNAGFEFLKSQNPEFVIFLNNDTIVDKGFIEPLIKPFLENSMIGQTVPKIFYEDDPNKIWYAGGNVNIWLGQIYHSGIRKYDNSRYSISQYTNYATGCCFCIRYKYFDELGGFDISYPMYGEDVDLSLRIRANEKKILYVPDSIIWHKVSASIGGELSILKFKKKFLGLIKLFSKHTNIIQKITITLLWIISIPYLLIKLIYLIIKK